jgi:hypothetical protein
VAFTTAKEVPSLGIQDYDESDNFGDGAYASAFRVEGVHI